ncbi:hypothetical protein H257_07653 [Aphanomyces astaci]|uniref:Uncharacterized protein n=1 Tax=Aphanomyces astaci TaxID=112090 RepID=W4GGL2_APHAT|nr:hypothetical protein H257_07653 [Aphanomyces astaci]ETV78825.1 hypothetical protein H257_07653 [Aphanomyces astaci]|eukprot:XP_009831544.1 hypothetical protein H257_07653 [Aphanomyces astaci]
MVTRGVDEDEAYVCDPQTEVRQISPTHILLRFVSHVSQIFQPATGFVSVDEQATLKGVDVMDVDDGLKDEYVRRELIRRRHAELWCVDGLWCGDHGALRSVLASTLRWGHLNEGPNTNLAVPFLLAVWVISQPGHSGKEHQLSDKALGLYHQSRDLFVVRRWAKLNFLRTSARSRTATEASSDVLRSQ